jgi:phosphoribosylformimino-5-aminoimidazole carboxamide ribotide isomerase
MLADHCDEFLVHAADVEGKCNGIEQDLVSMLAGWANIPVTYAGGVASFNDLEIIRRTGRGKVDVTIGSALDIFGGYLPYDEVVTFCSE